MVDAHHHLWRLAQVDWLSPEQTQLYRDYEADELSGLIAGVGVTRTVCVQANNTSYDTRQILARAAENDFIAAVVGWVDLAAPDVAERLDEWAQCPTFRGVRHIIQLEQDPNWLAREDVAHGLRAIAARGLTFDVHAEPQYLERIGELAAKVDGLRIVIDHLASPPIAAYGWEPWASAVRQVAQSPLVHMKVSGLGTAAGGTDWTVADIQPYVDHAIDCFGPARLMAGSDWPVSLLASSYARTWDALQQAAAGLSKAERAELFSGTALRFYGIEGRG